jgi:hypothetical protein
MKAAINPLNAELNSIFHLLALLGAHTILHVSRIRVFFLQEGCEGVDWVLLSKEGIRWLLEMFQNDPI